MALNFPNSPTVGQVYTDTTSGFSYEWDGTVWKSYSPASASNIKILDDLQGSFNGSLQTFALTSNGVAVLPANAQSLIISLGGVVQEPGTDYTVSTTNITFTTAPEAALSFSGISLGPAVPITYANDGVIYIRNTYTGAGSTGPFSFPEGYAVGYLDVYRNGVRLSSGTDFVGTSGTNFFLTDAAAVSDEIEAIGYTITSIINSSTSFDNINVTGITTTGRLQVSSNANIVGIVTASGGFVGNVTGTATGLSGTPNITVGSVTSGNINSSGIVTATTFSGALTGNVTGTATGLSGTPNITVGSITSGNINSSGIVTATSFVGSGSGLTGLNIPAGYTELDSMLFG